MNRTVVFALLTALVAGAASGVPATAQENSAQENALRSAALAYLPKDAARRLFGAVTTTAPGKAWAIGEYWKGCYAGGFRMAPRGEHWQVMRLSRNRNWGQPYLLAFLQRFSETAAQATGWPGILIGDMSQPRGGPMLLGHASHQLGIEADIWLRPMPEKPFGPEDVEEQFSTVLVRADGKDVDPKAYTPAHLAILRAAARQPEVARVFVNAAIKKALCRDAGTDRAWLRKIRPVAGHTYHFHIRLACPKDQTDCIDQTPPLPGDGCGKELDYWFTDAVLRSNPGRGSSMPVKAMPKECRELVGAPAAAH